MVVIKVAALAITALVGIAVIALAVTALVVTTAVARLAILQPWWSSLQLQSSRQQKVKSYSRHSQKHSNASLCHDDWACHGHRHYDNDI